MSAVQAPAGGPMDSCNGLGIPPLKAAFGPMAGLSIFLAWLLTLLAGVAAFLPWSEFAFPTYASYGYGFKFNFGLKYFFLSVTGTGFDGIASGGGLLYLDPYCPTYFGSLAFTGSSSGNNALYAVGANLCTMCNDSKTWTSMWIALLWAGAFMVVLSSYVACCKCICCCTLGTYTRSFLFLVGLVTLAVTASAKAQNAECEKAIQTWADYMLGSSTYQDMFPGMTYNATAGGSALASGCIAIAVIMLLFTVVFPWPLGRTLNEPIVDATQFNQDTKPPFPQAPAAAPAYPQQAPAYPGNKQ
jgi:hypothetical protein